MENSKRQRKRLSTATRKKQILEAALICFSRKGYAESTTAEIAQTAAISEGTIYNYFTGKQEILLSLIQRYIQHESMANLFEHASGSDIEVFLKSLAEQRLNAGFHSSDILPLLINEIQRDRKFRKEYYKQILFPSLKLIEGYLESGKTRFNLRPVNVPVVAHAFIALIIGMVILYLIEGKKGSLRGIPQEKIACEVAQLIVNGLRDRC